MGVFSEKTTRPSLSAGTHGEGESYKRTTGLGMVVGAVIVGAVCIGGAYIHHKASDSAPVPNGPAPAPEHTNRGNQKSPAAPGAAAKTGHTATGNIYDAVYNYAKAVRGGAYPAAVTIGSVSIKGNKLVEWEENVANTDPSRNSVALACLPWARPEVARSNPALSKQIATDWMNESKGEPVTVDGTEIYGPGFDARLQDECSKITLAYSREHQGWAVQVP